MTPKIEPEPPVPTLHGTWKATAPALLAGGENVGEVMYLLTFTDGRFISFHYFFETPQHRCRSTEHGGWSSTEQEITAHYASSDDTTTVTYEWADE